MPVDVARHRAQPHRGRPHLRPRVLEQRPQALRTACADRPSAAPTGGRAPARRAHRRARTKARRRHGAHARHGILEAGGAAATPRRGRGRTRAGRGRLAAELALDERGDRRDRNLGAGGPQRIERAHTQQIRRIVEQRRQGVLGRRPAQTPQRRRGGGAHVRVAPGIDQDSRSRGTSSGSPSSPSSSTNSQRRPGAVEAAEQRAGAPVPRRASTSRPPAAARAVGAGQAVEQDLPRRLELGVAGRPLERGDNAATACLRSRQVGAPARRAPTESSDVVLSARRAHRPTSWRPSAAISSTNAAPTGSSPPSRASLGPRHVAEQLARDRQVVRHRGRGRGEIRRAEDAVAVVEHHVGDDQLGERGVIVLAPCARRPRRAAPRRRRGRCPRPAPRGEPEQRAQLGRQRVAEVVDLDVVVGAVQRGRAGACSWSRGRPTRPDHHRGPARRAAAARAWRALAQLVAGRPRQRHVDHQRGPRLGRQPGAAVRPSCSIADREHPAAARARARRRGHRRALVGEQDPTERSWRLLVTPAARLPTRSPGAAAGAGVEQRLEADHEDHLLAACGTRRRRTRRDPPPPASEHRGGRPHALGGDPQLADDAVDPQSDDAPPHADDDQLLEPGVSSGSIVTPKRLRRSITGITTPRSWITPSTCEGRGAPSHRVGAGLDDLLDAA